MSCNEDNLVKLAENQHESTELDELEALIAKYSGAGPRYTSYPTAVEFNAREGWGNTWKELLLEDNQGVLRLALNKIFFEQNPRSYSIYLHLPFCHSLCYYCACNKIIPRDRSIVSPYLAAIEKEMARLSSILPANISIEQIHWGGGTPNFLLPEEMEQLHQATVRYFPNLQSDAEISVEVDPRTTSRAHLETLKGLGFNRVSLGVQDFDPTVQETINRIQTLDATRDVCEVASALGFSGVNIDLIYGLPNQTVDGFSKTIGEVIALHPSRLAIYGYAHVTWKEKAQKALERAIMPTPKDRIHLFSCALNGLAQAGYTYIGMDHFARPEDPLATALTRGRLGRNFMGYTTHAGVRVLGFGVSSISSLPHLMVQNVKDVKRYIDLMGEGSWAIERGLHKNYDDCIRADAIHKILCSGSIRLDEFEDQWSIGFENYFEGAIRGLASLQADGLVELSNFDLRVTELGRLFARNIAMCFDAYLEGHRAQRVFSQTV